MYPKKIVMLRKCGRDTTVDKENMFFEIVEYIDCHSDEQFDILNLRKMMEENLRDNKCFIFHLNKFILWTPFFEGKVTQII